MTSLVRPTRIPFDRLTLPSTPEAWLAELDDLSVLHIGGEDPSRLRIVSVLLHGNEPSSLRAAHRFFRGSTPPATDVWLLIGAVSAALEPPGHAHRFLPGQRDMNRIWLPPFEDAHGQRASVLADMFRGSGAEALLDIHNNTGHNPPYGVGPDDRPLPRRLASLFGELFVHTPIRLGTLMESVADALPCVAVECGRAGDPAADEIALQGLERFLGLPALEDLEGRERDVRVLGDPVRVTVAAGARIAFGAQPQPDVELTLDPAIDRHNFRVLPHGEVLGWMSGDTLPLRALGGDGRDRADELFEIDGDRVRVGAPFMPVMMTTSVSAAIDDCLFYAVHPR